MRDPGNGADLELLHAQRARLASRLRTPRWYVVATTLAWAVAFAMPIGSRYLTGAGIGSALLAIVVFLLAQHALARASGLDLGIATWKYPSGRAWTVAIVVIILSADAVEVSLLDHRLLAAAIVVGGLATPAASGGWQGHLRGIRHDLESGRAA